MMMKCFILILSVFVGSQAEAQFAPNVHSQMNRQIGTAAAASIRGKSDDGPYKFENYRVVDRRNQNVNARTLDAFVGLKQESRLFSMNSTAEKVRYELNQKVKYTCRVPWKMQKRGEGTIEAIRGIGAKHYVKVQGCEYLVEASLIYPIEERPQQKQQARSKAVAQRASQ